MQNLQNTSQLQDNVNEDNLEENIEAETPPDSPTPDNIEAKHFSSEESDFNPRHYRIRSNDVFTDEEFEEQETPKKPIIVKSTPIKERKSRALKKYKIPLKSRKHRHHSRSRSPLSPTRATDLLNRLHREVSRSPSPLPQLKAGDVCYRDAEGNLIHIPSDVVKAHTKPRTPSREKKASKRLASKIVAKSSSTSRVRDNSDSPLRKRDSPSRKRSRVSPANHHGRHETEQQSLLTETDAFSLDIQQIRAIKREIKQKPLPVSVNETLSSCIDDQNSPSYRIIMEKLQQCLTDNYPSDDQIFEAEGRPSFQTLTLPNLTT